MSEFVYLFRTTESDRQAAMGNPEQAKRSMAAWMAWIQALEAKGKLAERGRPLDPGGRQLHGRRRQVTDGPFAESKDIVLGLMIVEARDLAEATWPAAARCSTGTGRSRSDLWPRCRAEAVS